MGALESHKHGSKAENGFCKPTFMGTTWREVDAKIAKVFPEYKLSAEDKKHTIGSRYNAKLKENELALDVPNGKTIEQRENELIARMWSKEHLYWDATEGCYQRQSCCKRHASPDRCRNHYERRPERKWCCQNWWDDVGDCVWRHKPDGLWSYFGAYMIGGPKRERGKPRRGEICFK